MVEWKSVKNDGLPKKQCECVFYREPFEWWAGMFTPCNMSDSGEPVFQYHEHWGDDCYHTIDGVINYIILPLPSIIRGE